MKLVVFLGNPGKEYEKTRHNIGFIVGDSFLKDESWQTKFKAQMLKKDNIVYLKPQTYMNLSGESVQSAVKFFGIKPEDVLVVHDDLEHKFGDIVLRQGGGLGGHNGLRSIKANLNTENFWRIRFGIGRPEYQDIASYVIARFSKEEEAVLDEKCTIAAELIQKWSNS